MLSSPSGAGKTTLARRLLDADPDLALSVSVTTRQPRPGEVEGKDYYFIDEAEFERMKDAGELLEWAQVFDKSYGTPRAPVMAALAAGRDMLFDIDWQGARQLKAQLPADVVSRLHPAAGRPGPGAAPAGARAGQRRGRGATHGGGGRRDRHWPEYDYVLVNSDLDASLAGLQSILAAERLKRERQTGMADFVAGVLASL